MTQKNPVVHFEMPYKDNERLVKFYSQAFGWNMKDVGGAMSGYIMAHTAETDESNMVKTPGTINGGFYPLKPDWPAQYPSVVIAVEDINQAILDIKASGGEVLGEPMTIPGIGQYVSFLDTEGNRVSILQPISI